MINRGELLGEIYVGTLGRDSLTGLLGGHYSLTGKYIHLKHAAWIKDFRKTIIILDKILYFDLAF